MVGKYTSAVSIYHQDRTWLERATKLQSNSDHLTGDAMLIYGDLNFPHIAWSRSKCWSFLIQTNIDDKNSTLIDLLAFAEFTLHNFISYRDDRILDLVFSTKVEAVNLSECDLAIVTPNSYHPPVEFYLRFSSNTALRDKTSTFYKFKKADYNGLNNFFYQNRDSILVDKLVNESVSNFYVLLKVQSYLFQKLQLSTIGFPNIFLNPLFSILKRKI